MTKAEVRAIRELAHTCAGGCTVPFHDDDSARAGAAQLRATGLNAHVTGQAWGYTHVLAEADREGVRCGPVKTGRLMP